MSLEDWLTHRWLIRHNTSPQEISDLLTLIQRDLRECRTETLSTDRSFNIAYNAALQVATLALVACGYRAAREAHHERTIESLKHTISADNSVIKLMQEFRKKRNLVEYHKSGVISDLERTEMILTAEDLYNQIYDWLRENHPELLE